MIFGIDYGTTHSSISIFLKDKIKLLKKNNKVKLDSTVYEKDNLFYYDKNDYSLNKIRKIKRYINEISREKEDVLIENKYSLKFLLSDYFDYLISIIKSNFPNEDIKAVITVPSYFNHHQRNFIKSLWESKKVEIIRIISEPSSAVMGYYYHHPSSSVDTQKVITFDEGGGTLDISVLEKDEEFYQVIDHEGDLYLGGEDFTEEIKKNVGCTFPEAENRKLLNQENDIKLYQTNLEKIRNIIEKLKSRHDFEEIDKVIMVGRGSKLFGIKKLLEEYFPDKLQECDEQDNLVVIGAGYYGEVLNPSNQISSDLIMVDTTPLSIGIETADKNFSVIIPRNSVLPASGSRKYLPSEDDDEITLKIYQGEKGLAEENSLIEEIDIPANPNVFIDSVYKITLKLDLNGIIYLKTEDLNDNKYGIERILKHQKVDNISDFEQTAEDIEKFNKRSEKYLIKQMISRITENINNSKMENKEDLNDYFNKILNKLDELELNNLLKIKTEIEEEYGHLQYSKNETDYLNNKEDYSSQWKRDFLESKLKGFLDIITLSDSIKELVNSTLERITEIDLDELEDRVNQIENTMGENNHYQDLKDLIYYLEFTLINEKEQLELNEDNEKKLEKEINRIKELLVKEDLDWEKVLNDFNSFCGKII